MAIGIITNFDVNTNRPIDSKMGPYTTVAEATGSIDPLFRYIGQTVIITGSGTPVEYWFNPTTASTDLVVKGNINNNSITSSGTTLYSIIPPISSNFSTTHSILLGFSAGNNSPGAQYSNFIGYQAGQNATNALYSNFIGNVAGTSANNASLSNFIGSNAGANATDAVVSNFIGWYTGFGAVSASYSNFIGQQAGENAKRADYSNIIGFCSGLLAVSASYSTLIGYNIGRYSTEALGALGIKSNNIIIGTNITLPNGAQDSINLGGIIFATGSYSTTTGFPFSGSAGGSVGINIPVPSYNLHVSGTVSFPNLSTSPTALTDVLMINSSGQLFTTASSAIGGGSGTPAFPFSGNAVITGSLLVSGSGVIVTGSLNSPNITGSLQGTASWANNARTASFLPVGTYNITASWASNALKASSLEAGITYDITASWANNAVSALSANNGGVTSVNTQISSSLKVNSETGAVTISPVYTQLVQIISQTTAEPTVIQELINTTGEAFTWSKPSGDGIYQLTANGSATPFTDGKTAITINVGNPENRLAICWYEWVDNTTIKIYTYGLEAADFVDGFLTKATLDIKIFE
jgi:hypothetical protein